MAAPPTHTRGLSLVKGSVNDKHTGALDLLALKGLLAFAVDHLERPAEPDLIGWRAEARVSYRGDQRRGLVYARPRPRCRLLALDADRTPWRRDG